MATDWYVVDSLDKKILCFRPRINIYFIYVKQVFNLIKIDNAPGLVSRNAGTVVKCAGQFHRSEYRSVLVRCS